MLSNEENKNWNKRPPRGSDVKGYEVYDAEKDIYIVVEPVIAAIKKSPRRSGGNSLCTR